jgi:hypothetical protein
MQFERAVQALSDAGVEFVIIGGLSATFHGSARVTYDLDICYFRTSANLRRLAAALAPFHPRSRGFPAGLPFVWDETTLRNGAIFTLQTDIGEIDLLAEVAGLGDFEAVKGQSITVEAFDRRVVILDLPGLIRRNAPQGGRKDLSTLSELESYLFSAENTRRALDDGQELMRQCRKSRSPNRGTVHHARAGREQSPAPLTELDLSRPASIPLQEDVQVRNLRYRSAVDFPI